MRACINLIVYVVEEHFLVACVSVLCLCQGGRRAFWELELEQQFHEYTQELNT